MGDKIDDFNSQRSWNVLDRIIAKFRYVQVDKYISDGGNVVDIGCGQEGAFLMRHKDPLLMVGGLTLKYRIINKIILLLLIIVT